MITVELSPDDIVRIRTLFQTIRAATDPTHVRTKTAVFVPQNVLNDLSFAYSAMGREGLWDKLVHQSGGQS